MAVTYPEDANKSDGRVWADAIQFGQRKGYGPPVKIVEEITVTQEIERPEDDKLEFESPSGEE